jgi:pantetheine-phosphate adenylyltransferase
MTRALYPGSFDPIHNGHIDIATRASALFREVIMAIYDSPSKKLLFTTDERVELAQEALAHLPNVSVVAYTGLTVKFAREVGTQVIVRGLRHVADFESERQMGWANHDLAPEVELCCFFCTSDYANLSATLLKEVASLGGDVHRWTPAHVQAALESKLPRAEALPSSRSLARSAGKLAHRDS